MIRKEILLMITLFCSLITACKKKEPETYSSTPEIGFVSISPAVATEFSDSITIVISYTDGDGDLGENNANADNLFVTDQRINITYPFRIKQLSPDNSTVAIKGKLNVVLKNTAITDGSTQQNVSYSIYMKDRAGHQSNTVSTSPITIKQ